MCKGVCDRAYLGVSGEFIECPGRERRALFPFLSFPFLFFPFLFFSFFSFLFFSFLFFSFLFFSFLFLRGKGKGERGKGKGERGKGKEKTTNVSLHHRINSTTTPTKSKSMVFSEGTKLAPPNLSLICPPPK